MIAMALVVLAASPNVTVAVPGFRGSVLKPEELHSLEQRFVNLAQSPGVRFVTGDDLLTLVGIERQKQLLGCASDDCLAELSSAMGAELVLNGDVTRLGDELVFNLRALRVSNGNAVYTASNRFKDVGAINDWIESEAPEIGRRLGDRAPDSRSSLVRHSPVIVGGAGVAAVIGGSFLFASSKADASTLKNRTGGDYNAIAARGATNEKLGVGLLVGGGVLAAAGIALWASGATSAPAPVALVPTPGGASLVVGGRF
jgi:hypothetical protein